MEPKPLLQSVHHSDSGKECGPQKTHDKARTVTIAANHSIKQEPLSINLGLRIGANTAQNPVTNKHVKPVFTPAQWHELQLQALIFKYLSARLPVPLHLVIPIWKSVANSLGSANIYKQYPSFIGFSPQGFDYRNMMDPEPGRCRRTDGKKWRCSKDVMPDQKYCERHIHRGRQRSRKPVEASEIASPSNTTPVIKSNNDLENSNANLSASSPVIQLMIPSCSSTSTSNNTTTPTTTTSTSSYSESNKNVSGNNVTTAITLSTTTTTPSTSSTAIVMASNNNNSSINNHNIDSKNDRDNHGGNINIINSSSNSGSSSNLRNNVSPGMGFSPKSVLQVLGCSSSCFDHSSSMDLELGRCRRTDGKKWRCSKGVVPDQKYCGQHMHRGAKKHAGASQPVAIRAASATVTNHLPLTTTMPNKADCAILNTSLSIAIPASCQLTTNDGKSTTSSDSDTTITDTTITAYENSNVSS